MLFLKGAHNPMFIGRQKELSVLENAYTGKQSALIPVYGRRRVGKSELILKFLGHKPCIYYLGKMAPATLQIREFLQEAARALDEPLLSSLSANSWSEVFAAVSSKCKSRAKFVIALDEFQWMVGASPELPSVIQEYWDRHWKNSGNIVFILCGSYIGFMERKVLGRKSPLFGRRTAQILLRPFSYLEAAEFHRRWSLLNRALVYFICGGIPLYLRFFNQAYSVERNIDKVQELTGSLGKIFDGLAQSNVPSYETIASFEQVIKEIRSQFLVLIQDCETLFEYEHNTSFMINK